MLIDKKSTSVPPQLSTREFNEISKVLEDLKIDSFVEQPDKTWIKWDNIVDNILLKIGFSIGEIYLLKTDLPAYRYKIITNIHNAAKNNDNKKFSYGRSNINLNDLIEHIHANKAFTYLGWARYMFKHKTASKHSKNQENSQFTSFWLYYIKVLYNSEILLIPMPAVKLTASESNILTYAKVFYTIIR